MNNSHYRVGPGCQLTPSVSDSETGEAASMARRTAKLADGNTFGEFDGTGVLPKFSRAD